MRPLKWQIMSVYTNKLSHFFPEHAPWRQRQGGVHITEKNLEDVAVMVLLAPW